ncbi:MAG: hypothetical protein K8T20_17790 [Planctomycetes bacterium]|nr:hypothetical protein [Planctomycetota bacterium]
MRVATSGDGTVAMWTASRYDPSSALRTAWGKLFRLIAWAAGIPSFAMLVISAVMYGRLSSPKEVVTLAYFVMDYVAACGIGLTALFASIALPRIRRRDVPILFGGCVAAVLFLYLPSLLRAWPMIQARKFPAVTVVSLAFPFALLAVAIAAASMAKRARGHRDKMNTTTPGRPA